MRKLWEDLRESFWFLPLLIAGACALLAVLVTELDRADLPIGGWAYAGRADGALALLSTIAGSMVTVAGVTFSVNVVALTVASQQFGPRLLRTFLRDRAHQAVFGVFLGTFLYAVLVLRVIDGEDFVPRLAVTTAVALSVVALGALIFLVHHLSHALQANELIGQVAHELQQSVDRLCDVEAERAEAERAGELPAEPGRPVHLEQDGYVQIVDDDDLLEVAQATKNLIRVDIAPGAFTSGRRVVARAWGPADPRVDEGIARSIVLGRTRTPVQDLGFLLTQLADITCRALSPSVNDPFTALACLDRLESAFERLAAVPLHDVQRRDEEGRLRVSAARPPFEALLADVFAVIRPYVAPHPVVTERAVIALRRISGCVDSSARRDAVEHEIEALVERAARVAPAPSEA